MLKVVLVQSVGCFASVSFSESVIWLKDEQSSYGYNHMKAKPVQATDAPFCGLIPLFSAHNLERFLQCFQKELHFGLENQFLQVVVLLGFALY